VRGGSWLSRWIGALILIVATVMILDWAFTIIAPWLPFLAGGAVIAGGIYAWIWWRRRRGYY
jgi:hypothetical protein